MLENMKRYISRSEYPVGVVKPPLSQLPPSDHVYGYKPKGDEAGVGEGINNKLIKLNLTTYFSHKKLDGS